MHIAAAGDQGYGLLAGVDQIPVDLVVARRRPDAEDAVLAMQHDLAVGGNEIGNQVRQPDPQVHIGAVDEVLRGPPRDLATFERHRFPPFNPTVGLTRHLHETVYKDAGGDDHLGIELTEFDDVTDL